MCYTKGGHSRLHLSGNVTCPLPRCPRSGPLPTPAPQVPTQCKPVVRQHCFKTGTSSNPWKRELPQWTRAEASTDKHRGLFVGQAQRQQVALPKMFGLWASVSLCKKGTALFASFAMLLQVEAGVKPRATMQALEKNQPDVSLPATLDLIASAHVKYSG